VVFDTENVSPVYFFLLFAIFFIFLRWEMDHRGPILGRMGQRMTSGRPPIRHRRMGVGVNHSYPPSVIRSDGYR
jgi:hypothetical protein